jgi:hypothetical protein
MHTLQSAPDNGSLPGVDRQWLTFVDNDTVLMNYNRQAPRYVEVIKSTDGGLTYDPSTAVQASAEGDEFPGPMHTLPAGMNWAGGENPPRVVYFPWTNNVGSNFYVNLSVSTDGGSTWKACKVATSKHDMSQSFPVADNDEEGNIYVTWTEDGSFHTYLSTLPGENLSKCSAGMGGQPKIDPGFSRPVQVDRGKVRTTVFPWLTAEGSPGRVAVAFYGTKAEGNPNTSKFHAAWDVYVNQSLNALSGRPAFSQVKATYAPMHYDSICLNGLGCDVPPGNGDRTLADFFAIDYNPQTKKLMVVYNRAQKKPGEAAGHVATPMVATQIGGPSNGGGTVDAPASNTSVVRKTSVDPQGDALSSYSQLVANPGPANEPAADFTSVSIRRQTNLKTGERINGGGFDVTMKVKDLSDAALQQEMQDTGSTSLLWTFYFVNGFQPAAASVYYDQAQGFTFGFNQYSTNAVQCGSDNEKCVVFPGDLPVKGKVDQDTGTMTLSVPRKYLRALIGSTDGHHVPKQVQAWRGSRLYDAEAFSFGNSQPVQQTQSFLYTLDNTPPMDFRVPGHRALKRPKLRLGFNRYKPRRNHRFHLVGTLLACVDNPIDKKRLRDTKVTFQRRRHGHWRTIGRRGVDRHCRAHLLQRARFKRAVYRALWPKQLRDYRSGHSGPRVQRTTR